MQFDKKNKPTLTNVKQTKSTPSDAQRLWKKKLSGRASDAPHLKTKPFLLTTRLSEIFVDEILTKVFRLILCGGEYFVFQPFLKMCVRYLVFFCKWTNYKIPTPRFYLRVSCAALCTQHPFLIHTIYIL